MRRRGRRQAAVRTTITIAIIITVAGAIGVNWAARLIIGADRGFLSPLALNWRRKC